MKDLELMSKIVRIIDSCETPEQLASVYFMVYGNRTRKRLCESDREPLMDCYKRKLRTLSKDKDEAIWVSEFYRRYVDKPKPCICDELLKINWKEC